MAQSITIDAQARDPQKNKGTGSRVARKLRAQGRIPAIVYGHKQAPQPISVARDDAWLLIKKAAHLATLRIDGAAETVLVRELQWDHLGKDLIHLDFSRVSAEEEIETRVKLVIHGHAPGTNEGGILETLMHDLTITCRANAIPDEVRVAVGELHVNQGLHVRDLVLPEGVKAKDDAEKLVVHVVARAAAPEPAAGEVTTAEPEVIGGKKEDKEKKEEGKEK